MAKAYKCDVCNIFFINKEAPYQNYGMVKIYNPYGQDKKLDLCPECQEKLDRFIGLGKTEDSKCNENGNF